MTTDAGIRVIICGSRTFEDEEFLFSKMDEIHARTPISLVIEGECDVTEINADKLGRKWAESRGIEVLPFPTEVSVKIRRSAGPIRNNKMLREGHPDLVVAFIDQMLSTSRGTSHMISIAERAKVPHQVHMNLPGKGEVSIDSEHE
ncbi:MAG TPA: DUF2493 domain-containing protein [Candidatus Paceibacterota bacterium]|jgi:hypothetical protein